MSLFSKLFGSDKSQTENAIKENPSKVESAVAVQSNDVKDDGELVAVIMAALMNMLSGDAVSDLQIKSIRRIGRHSPIWNAAGRDEYIASRI
jgi:hypothetical protein